MSRLLAFLIIAVCFVIFTRTYWIWALNRTRREGRYPWFRKPTMFDVKKLLEEDDKVAAVQLYREIFGVTSQEAQQAINELDKSIKEKG